MPDSNNPEQCSNKERKHPLEYFIAGFLVLTFVATAIAAYYTRLQSLTADDTEKRSLRAYILANQPSVIIDDFNIVHARVQIKNSGLTPAYRVFGWGCLVVGHFQFSESAISLEMDFPSGAPSDEATFPKSIIGPGDIKEQINFSFCNVKPAIIRALTPDERTRLRDGIAAIYIWRGNLCRRLWWRPISRISVFQ